MPTVLDYVRTASPSSDGHLIKASDWGVLAPGATGTAFSAGGNLTASTTGGSLPTSTGAFRVTWVTANGESAESVEATVSVTGATGSVTVNIAPLTANSSTQANAAPIIGWNVYSGNGSGNELRNITSAGLNGQALSSVVLPNGTTITFIPIATTSVQVDVYGTGAAPPVTNFTGLQPPLPQVPANSSSDTFLVVKRTFQVQKSVNWIRPNSTADAAGLAPGVMDCVGPDWAQNTAFAVGNVILLNRTVFIVNIAGTTSNTTTPPAGLTTRPAKFTTVTDGSVTWMSLGEAALVRARWVNMTASAGQPLAQEYDLYQE